MIWTRAQDAILVRMWNEGFSCALISEAISGSTRSGVIGRAHRIIKSKDSPIQLRGPSRNADKSRPAGRPPRKDPETIRLNRNQYQRWWRDQKKAENREQFRASGANVYSAAYRKHLPHIPEMTKGELRAMLAQAVANTARMT